MGICLAGVDIGTSGTKGMVFDTSGNPLANVYREYPCAYPRLGWVEQDVGQVVEVTMGCLAKAVAASGVKPGEIAAFSLSAQRSCGIFLDERERLVRPMISWQDNRSPVEVREIAARIDEAQYYKHTGYPNSTTWLLSKMMWVRKNEPEVWKKTRRVVQMHDYFLRALGVEEYYVDHNDAGFFGFFDSTAGVWDEELLQLFDIPKQLLPIPERSGTLVGKVSASAAKRCGLAAGTPIAVGAGDQSAGAVGAGIVRPGLVSISMGTAGAVTAFLSQPFRDPAGRAMVTAHPMANRWLLEGYQAAAASVYRWYRDQFGGLERQEAEKKGEDFYDLMNARIAAVPPGANGLLVLPYFASAGTPRYNPSARGTVLGLTFSHDRFALARAFMEGITLDMKDMLTAITNSGVAVREARLLGGPTKSRIWNQIQADVYGVPVNALRVTDATVLGAAVLGGVGAGVFPSIEAGSDRLVRLGERYEPNTENVIKYRRLYELFCRAYEQMDSGRLFAELAALQEVGQAGGG